MHEIAASPTRVDALLATVRSGLLVEDAERRVVMVNDRFVEMFGLPSPEVMVGADCALAAEGAKHDYLDPDGFIARIGEILAAGEPVLGDELFLVDGRVFSRSYAPVLDERGGPGGHLWRYEDVTELREREVELARSNAMLAAVASAEGGYVRDQPHQRLFEKLLESLIDLTGSEYGFIGEVLFDDGAPYIKTWAYTDIAWDMVTRQLVDEAMANDGGLEFRNVETLFGRALTGRDVVIANDAAADPRGAGVPEGHPPLRAFLGVPLFDGDELIGMFGVANRPGGYDEQLVTSLEPFSAAAASLIRAYRTESMRRAAEQAEREARLAAEQANAQKTEFLARLSHELRTPLHAILGFAELMADSATDAVDREHTAVIVEAATHLTGLVDELFEISHIERGNIRLAMAPVDMAMVVADALAIAGPEVAQRGATLISSVGVGDVVVEADRVRLQECVLNLVRNALVHGGPGVTVEVSVAPTDDGARLVVADDGPGIAPDDQQRVFEPFLQLERRGEGLGLGLAITRSLVEAMAGRVEIQSGEGRGTTFVVTLSAATAPSAG